MMAHALNVRLYSDILEKMNVLSKDALNIVQMLVQNVYNLIF